MTKAFGRRGNGTAPQRANNTVILSENGEVRLLRLFNAGIGFATGLWIWHRLLEIPVTRPSPPLFTDEPFIFSWAPWYVAPTLTAFLYYRQFRRAKFPPESMARLSKWFRKYFGLVIAAFLVCVALTGGSTFLQLPLPSPPVPVFFFPATGIALSIPITNWLIAKLFGLLFVAFPISFAIALCMWLLTRPR